jgi:hypothetical protein
LVTKEHPDEAEENPYNKAVADFIDRSELGEVFRFTDEGVKKESLPILDDLAIYIHKLSHANFDYNVENGSSARAGFFKNVNDYIASVYWEKVTSYPDVLLPRSLVDKWQKSKRQLKKNEFISHRSLLYDRLVEMNKGDHKDRMANAFCHMIRSATLKGMRVREEYYKSSFISKHKRFTPTLQMLSIKGYIPDVKISKYKSLFISSEWDSIFEGTLHNFEKEIGELMKKQLTPNNLLDVLRRLEEIRRSIDKDEHSCVVKRIRRERLLIAARMKQNSKKKGSFKLSEAINANLHDQKILDAFNPFRIPFANGDIETSPGQALTVLDLNDDSHLYYYVASPHNDDLDKGAVKRICLNFVAWLNS